MANKSVRAGALNQRIQLLEYVVTRDTFGDVIESWGVVGSVWAHVQHLSGRESVEAGTKWGRGVQRVTIRYRSDIDHTWRFTHRGKTYQVVAVLPDPDSGLESIILIAELAPVDAQ